MSETAFPAALHLVHGPVSAVDLALFAAASGDHNPLHLDAGVAAAAGFDRPVVHGMLSMALAGRLFTQRFGAGCVKTLQTRFTGVAVLGDHIELTATRIDAQDGEARYALGARTSQGTELLTGEARIAILAAP